MATNDALLTINDVSKKLGVSKLTLRNWDNNGTLKAVRIGSRGDRRYRQTDIDVLLTPVNTSHEIDRVELDDFLAHNTLWVGEAPAYPITLELGAKRMV